MGHWWSHADGWVQHSLTLTCAYSSVWHASHTAQLPEHVARSVQTVLAPQAVAFKGAQGWLVGIREQAVLPLVSVSQEQKASVSQTNLAVRSVQAASTQGTHRT